MEAAFEGEETGGEGRVERVGVHRNCNLRVLTDWPATRVAGTVRSGAGPCRPWEQLSLDLDFSWTSGLCLFFLTWEK